MSQKNNQKYLKNKDKKTDKESIIDILNDSFTIPQEKFIINNEELDSFFPKKINSLNTQSFLSSYPTFSTITSRTKEKKLSHSNDSKRKKTNRKESCFKEKNKKKKKKVNFKDKLVEVFEIQSYKQYNQIENINSEVKNRVYCRCDIY